MTARSTERATEPGLRRTGWADWVGLWCRLLLGGVMLYAGLTKATNIPETQQATRAYQLLPYDLANAWGAMMPFVEIVVGLLLILGLMTRLSAVIATLLMIAFIIGIASAWARGIKIDCGCFGGGGATADPKYFQELLRDVALLAHGLWLVVRPGSRFSLDRRLFG